MSDQYVGQIQAFGFNFNPQGWFQCNGQLLAISQYQALFALIGTTYGGNGTTTFGLPDLRGRTPIHMGQGPGLSNYNLGQASGTETVTLQINQLPFHNHQITANSGNGSLPPPTNNFLATAPPARGAATGPDLYNTAATANTTLNTAAISFQGGSQPHPNLKPFLTVNFCIAWVGVFPSRG
jgi:microcystin-dependent protein